MLQIISCAFMMGLIWTIQRLHYPAFASVDAQKFVQFHQQHSRNITFIVGPVMLLEVVTAFLLLLKSQSEIILQINFGLLILIWACTGLLIVPIHNTLSGSQDLKQIKKLVLTNWPRTILWSGRLAMLSAWALLT